MFGIKVKQIFPSLQNRLLSFDFNIGFIAILAIVNFLYKIRITDGDIIAAPNLWNPSWMLFGPFFYFAHRSVAGYKISFRWLHYVPFLLFFVFYVIAFLTTTTENVWDNALYTLYQNSFFAIPLSLTAYAIYGLKLRNSITNDESKAELLVFISGFMAIMGLLGVIMYLCWGVFSINMGGDYRLFTYAILLIMDIFILRYYMMTGKELYPLQEKDKEYTLTAKKDKFDTDTKIVSTKGLRKSDTLRVDLKIGALFEVGKVFRLKDINYDFDKDNIRPDAAKILDGLVDIMRDNPTLEIELGSHTDSRGKDAYNLALSQRRAQSVVNYLVMKGISRARMIAKGYGETQLLNGCDDGVPYTEEQHQENRRTEFKVLKY